MPAEAFLIQGKSDTAFKQEQAYGYTKQHGYSHTQNVE